MISQGNVHLVYYQLPVAGWLAPFFQEDEHTSVLAIDFPRNGHSVLKKKGIYVTPTFSLPRLARELQINTEEVLSEIDPPMLLFWKDKKTERLYLLNDGLGHAQLFEYEHQGSIALSNRIFAFQALDLPLHPVSEEWAAKCCSFFGWFPLNRTGFSHIKFVEPSTLYQWSSDGLHKQHLQVLEKWVQRESLPDEDCLELARTSLIDYIESTRPLFADASGGLTGGYDSRAIFSTYRHLGLNLDARVRGSANNFDVILSKELVKVAGMKLRWKDQAGLPPESTELLEHSIRSSLVWQAGNMVNHKLKTFLPHRNGISFGNVNVMGHFGAMGKLWWARKIMADEFEVSKYEEKLNSWFARKVPDCLRTDQKKNAKELIVEAYRQAAKFGVRQEKQLNFFYLFERSRRFESGSQNSQTSLVLSPFLNVNFIRAVFSYRGQEMKSNIFHRYIIQKHSPDWAVIPYEKEMKQIAQKDRSRWNEQNQAENWRQSDNINYYNQKLYWQKVGKDLLSMSIVKGKYWREIYDSSINLSNSLNIADELTMLYELEKLLN
ncbi:MAG: hypothetical protein QNJ70_03160 [Xenococcaceae cyanobacterium MO_207.B15]|nr:hypothetical protein [Xenococcaceae cyanobacterium MO_207.B15]